VTTIRRPLDPVEFVQDLRDRPGGDIGVHASISVAQTLLAADVVG
jgi:hypothetical protein